MAFADSFESEPKTEDHTMLLQGINAIVRAARVEAAPLPQPRADDFLVALDQENGRFAWQARKAAKMAAVRRIAGILPAFSLLDRVHVLFWLYSGFHR